WKVGLNEVQVGLILPPVIFQAFKRQVGTREAARAVRGLLYSPAEAQRIGLVEDVVPAVEAVERALQWAREGLALPQCAMLASRDQSRADLRALFSTDIEREIGEVVEMWWNPDVQAMLRAFVAKLKKK